MKDPMQARFRRVVETADSPAMLDTVTTVLLALVVQEGPNALDSETFKLVLAHAGLRPDMDANALTTGIVKFLQTHPPDPKLLTQMQRALTK